MSMEEPSLAQEDDLLSGLVDARIEVTCQCRTCNGAGVYCNSLWKEFVQFMEQWSRDNPIPKNENGTPIYPPWMTQRREAENQWWSDRGYNPNRLRPEEILCGDCEGTGRETVSVPLEALLFSGKGEK